MKPFNLEEYLNNPSKKVVTRDGRNVRIICTDHDNVSYPTVGAIKGYDFPFCFSEDGCVVGSKCNDANDLFFAPEKHEAWINLYRVCSTGGKYPGCRLFNTEKETKQGVAIKDDRYIATIKIEWEE